MGDASRAEGGRRDVRALFWIAYETGRGLPFLAVYLVLPILAQKSPADNRGTSGKTGATKLDRKLRGCFMFVSH